MSDNYGTFNDLFDDLFKKKSGLSQEERTLLQDRQHIFFEKSFSQDMPYLRSFLHNKHLESFGSLFRKFCDIIDISQNKLSDITKRGYDELGDKSILNLGANIGSLSHDSVSNAQLGSIRPTLQQVYFWLTILRQCFQELNLEILPEAEEAFYLLGVGGPPSKIADAIEFVKAIGPTQQWKIARPIEAIEKNTDFDIPSAHPMERKEIKSDMHIENVDEVRAAILKIKAQEQEPHR